MRTSNWPVFVVVTAASAAVFLAVACGGKEDPKTPGGSSGSSGTASASGGESTSGTSGSGGSEAAGSSGAGPGTTTTALDASDLQGAKLGSSTKKEIETKGDGGPKTPPGGKSDEPGRKREDIQTIIQSHRDEARACYDKALPDHPGIEGDLDIKWLINPDGTVSEIDVDQSKSQIHEESVGKCIIDVIKKIKFNASAKGFETRAHYPFNFHPKNTPGQKK